jgi:midasin (ATPase involved in ribosome maturation)
MLPASLVESIVRFNNCVQDIENRLHGQLGSPWEFNLFDAFRWCDLISNHYKSSGRLEHGAFINMRYIGCFGNLDCIRNDPRVN